MFDRPHSRKEPALAPVFDIEKFADYLLGEQRRQFQGIIENQKHLSEIVRTHNLIALKNYLLHEAGLFCAPLLDDDQQRSFYRFLNSFCISYSFFAQVETETRLPKREDLKELLDTYTITERWELFDAMTEENRERFVLNYLSDEEVKEAANNAFRK